MIPSDTTPKLLNPMKPHPTQPKSINWKFYLIVFISLELIIFFGLRYNYEEQAKNISNQYINNLRSTYQIVLNTLGLVSQTIFNEVINQPELVELLKQANHATPEQQEILRHQVYQKLQPIYERLKKQKLKLINFYLADGSCFLNINLDRDISFTPTEMSCGNSAKFNFNIDLLYGFREDAQGNYFRYVFSMPEPRQHVASIEIGMAFDAIIYEMLRVKREHYDFIVKKSVLTGAVDLKNPNNFQTSAINGNFLQQMNRSDEVQRKKFFPPTLRLLSEINQSLQPNVSHKLTIDYPFVEFVEIESQSYSVTFLPLENTDNKVVGYLVSYTKDDDLTKLNEIFYQHQLILTLTNLLFVFLIFQANRNRYIAEYQKENLATSNAILERWVDERVNELIESNISLHQEILDRKKVEEKLKLYQDHLEELVAERTQQLRAVNDELYEFNRERIEDILKLRQTEMALRESENMFRKVSQSLMDALIVINSLGQVMFWSNSAEKIFGYSEEEVLGRNLHTLIIPSGVTLEIAHSFVRFREDGEGDVFNKLLEFKALRKNGEQFPVEISIVALKLKGEWSAVGTVRDITYRKQKEQELQAAMLAMEQANRTIAEQNYEITENYTKLQQTLEYLQTAQRELVQSEKMAALGQLIAGVAHEINTPLGAIRSSVSSIDCFVNQDLISIPEFFQTLATERCDDFFALMRHATEQCNLLTSKEKRKFRKELTSQLQQAEIPNAELLADKLIEIGVYQEITPWLPLLQSSENQKVLDMAYQIIGLQKSTATIATASDRAAKVVFALKNFSRFDHTGKKVLAQVSDGIETVLTLYYNKLKFGVEVIRKYAETPQIYCFPDELSQVWTNLIHNALQAMDNQGFLTIQTTVVDHNIVVSITDTGNGIPDEIKERIFEPFFTTKPIGEGSGLGLDIVKKIVAKHDGKIELFSQLGTGTTFNVILPIVLEINEELIESINAT